MLLAIAWLGSRLSEVFHDVFEKAFEHIDKRLFPPHSGEKHSRVEVVTKNDATMKQEVVAAPSVDDVVATPSVGVLGRTGTDLEVNHSPRVPVSRYFMDGTSKRKYYAVLRGYNPGIYGSWQDCEPQVKGYGGQVYKWFKTKKEAEQYLHDGMRRAEDHARHGHRFSSVGVDRMGCEVWRCEYCLEVYRDAIRQEES